MDLNKPYYADAQAFLGFPGQAPKIEKGMLLDLALVTCAPPAGPHAQSFEMTLAACEVFKKQLDATDAARIVTRAEHIGIDGKLNVVLGLQNLPSDFDLCSNADFIRLRNTGIRVISLAYNGINPFGSGCLNLDVGLTDAGRDAIGRMAEFGFILDLSHASHRMAREALEYSDKLSIKLPVMASHGGCYAVYPHFRNLPDDVLIGIAERGGVVGIANLTFILGEGDSVGAFRRHIRHAMEVCGPRSVVIGSDAPYITYTEAEEQAVFVSMKAMTDPHGTWGSRYPMYLPDFAGPQKMDKIAEPPMPGVLQLGLNLRSFFKLAL